MPALVQDDGPVNETVRFPAGRHFLEGTLAYPEETTPVGAVVLAGPHPLLGGDMDNNVVRGLAGGLASRRVVTLRFNYRGVGGSEGPPIDAAAHLARFWETSHVPDEKEFSSDLTDAFDFLQAAAGRLLPTALLGYSFGCSMLPHAGAASGAPLVLVAPTVGVHDYRAYDDVKNPLMVVASDDDFAADASRLREWFDRLSAPKRLIQTRRDDHFFRGHEDWLSGTVFAFLQEQWG